MNIFRPRVHDVEPGDLSKTTIAVLRAYVEALGGNLEIVLISEKKTIALPNQFG